MGNATTSFLASVFAITKGDTGLENVSGSLVPGDLWLSKSFSPSPLQEHSFHSMPATYRMYRVWGEVVGVGATWREMTDWGIYLNLLKGIRRYEN